MRDMCRLLLAIRFLPILLPVVARAERVNHEGRILGPPPVVTAPMLFNTPAADEILAAMQVMPVDSAWNEDVSALPLLPNSAAMIARIMADLATHRQNLRLFTEMNFALVPDSQPVQPIRFFNGPAESDLDGGTSPVGQYPIPWRTTYPALEP
jgi:hypothetical protein